MSNRICEECEGQIEMDEEAVRVYVTTEGLRKIMGKASTAG